MTTLALEAKPKFKVLGMQPMSVVWLILVLREHGGTLKIKSQEVLLPESG